MSSGNGRIALSVVDEKGPHTKLTGSGEASMMSFTNLETKSNHIRWSELSWLERQPSMARLRVQSPVGAHTETNQ